MKITITLLMLTFEGGCSRLAWTSLPLCLPVLVGIEKAVWVLMEGAGVIFANEDTVDALLEA